MPQVPNPVPTVSVQDTPLPRVSVNTPEAAFGGATGAAIANLGRTIEGSGGELFARAVSLQQDNNHAEATEGATRNMVESGKLHAEYNSLQGDEAVKAYPKYQENLEKLRISIRDGLSNPAAKRLYDSESKSTMARNIFNGAGYAATQQKHFEIGASTARVEALKNQVYQSTDDKTFQASINSLEIEIRDRQARLGGWSVEKTDEEVAKAKSELAASRVLGIARNKPLEADQLRQEYEARKLLQGRDVDIVRNKVQSFTETVGTDAVTRQVLSKYLQGDGTYTKSAKEMREEAVEATKKMFPNDPKMETATINAFDKNYSAHNYIQTQEEREVKRQTDDHIVKGVTSVDLLPPDLVKRMSPQAIKDYPMKANSYRSAIDKQTNQLQYSALLGLYNNENEKFMDTDIIRIPGLSKDNINFFRKLQRESAPNGDPRIKRAMGWLEGYNPQILNDLGITGRLKDTTVANQFVGALHEAIQSYQEINGKAPDEKIVTKEIFPAVTRQVLEKGFFYNSKTPFFQSSIPNEYKRLYLNEYKKQYPEKPEPTDDEIRRDYNRQMFDKFFSGQKATKDQSRVGK